jgi:hypothetical protein
VLFSTREELAATIRRLQDEPEQRQALARAGYLGFLEHWTERAVVPRYLGIVRRAAEQKGDTGVLAKLASRPVAAVARQAG